MFISPNPRFHVRALVAGVTVALGMATAADAQPDRRRPAASEPRQVSPVRRIERARPQARSRRGPLAVRAADGSGNNLEFLQMGAAGTPLRRLLDPDYGDGIETLAGSERLSPREVSNIVCAQDGSRVNELGASDFLWQWGQFLDHDIDLTDGVDPPEPVDIPVPIGDPFFDPASTGSAFILFNRSVYALGSGTSPANPRQQLNEITSWIDASNVYGSDEERAAALRTNDGTGRLRTSAGNLLPFNTEGLPNAGGSDPSLFLAGDVRANEQVGLLALHTLFVREHNRLADEIAARNPELSDEEIYQRARRMVAGMMQVITYREFLPTLLGPRVLAPEHGYDPMADARISNIFSTAAYRFGHSALSPYLLRLDAAGNEISQGHLALRDAFFAPSRVVDEGGIDPLLRGLASQECQAIDPYVIDDVRNFLFGPPGAGGFDLASLNLQRGRDHGLPSYNDARVALGLVAVENFEEISPEIEIQSRLADAYGHVDDIDVWVGGLAEGRVPGSHLGPLFTTILKIQFEALHDGDRFWYSRALDRSERRIVERTRLADVIRRNTAIGRELPDDVFHVR